jgi:hypothetical protein
MSNRSFIYMVTQGFLIFFLPSSSLFDAPSGFSGTWQPDLAKAKADSDALVSEMPRFGDAARNHLSCNVVAQFRK